MMWASRWCLLPVLWAALVWPTAACSAQAIDLSRWQYGESVTQYLQLLRDEGATEQLSSAMQSPEWENINVSVLQEGYREGAFWLRGQLRNDSPVPVTRWLAMGSARLQDVQLHLSEPLTAGVPGAGLRWQPPQVAGTKYASAQREVQGRTALFALTLAPGEQRAMVLRVAGSSVIELGVALWDPAVFREEEGRELAFQAFVIGIALVLVTYALIQGVEWRDRGSVLMAVWICSALLFILSFQGYLYLYLLPRGGMWLVRVPITLGCLTTLLHLRMSYLLVSLDQLPRWERRWKRIYDVMSAALIVVTIWIAAGDFRATAPVANAIAATCYLMWAASMLHGWRHGLDNARLLAISFGLAWSAMWLKMLELNGLIAHGILPDWQFSTLFQLGLLGVASTMVVGRALQLHHKFEQMQWSVLSLRMREQFKLEQAVNHRTSELRAALEVADHARHSKNGFFTSISHDLRTPLTSILGFADMLQAAGGEQGRYGRIIVRSARHMLSMINDLIDYAHGDRMDLSQPRPLYVHGLLQTIGQEGAALARRQHNAFSLDVSPALPPVLRIDAPRLRRLLGNLLDNAAKYTREGSIRLEVGWQAAAVRSGTGVMEMRVSDTGSGIPLHYQASVFEPFERAGADRSQPGLGMGLALVRQWIQQMDGQIALQSQPGQGTVLTLQLPVALADEQDIARDDCREDSNTHPLIDGTGRRLLVVEDSPDIADLLVEQLEMLAFEVELYADGESAVARIMQTDKPAPALVLTDYLLPAAKGGEVLRATRQHLPGVPVLLLSATLRPPTDRPDDLAFDACLLKPVNFMELQETLARLLGLPLPQLGAALAGTVAAVGTVTAVAATSETTGDTAGQDPLPPQESLQQARVLIDSGAVSDLLDWGDALLQQHPQCAGFQSRVGQLLREGDLFAVEALVNTALEAVRAGE